MGLLFRPFSQVDGSASRRFGGTGLGLAISKRMAEMLGGDIVVRSSPGQGSTFSLSIATGQLDGLAMTHEPSKAVAAREPVANAQQKLDCRILLAEDGPDNQRLIAFLLRKAGAEVELAENGQIALDLALAAQQAGSPFDMILMDMQMPVMDGYEATQKLRSAGYKGPIIALTAHAMTGDRQKCIDAGCDDYITKPIDPKKLCAVTRTVGGEGTKPSLIIQKSHEIPSEIERHNMSDILCPGQLDSNSLHALPPLPPAKTYFAPAGRDTPAEICRKVAVIERLPLLKNALDAMPNMVMILNGNRQIVAANRKLLNILGASVGQLVEKRPGEAIKCIRAKEGPDGCGTGVHCTTCGAVNAIMDCHENTMPRPCGNAAFWPKPHPRSSRSTFA